MKFFNVIVLVATFIIGLAPMQSASAKGTYDKNKEAVEEAVAIINLERKIIISQNINLSDDEKDRFWSLYKEYRSKMSSVGKRSFKMIADYADSLNDDSLSNAVILRILKEYTSIERKKIGYKEEYIVKFQEILPPKKVFLFFQIENKFDANINFHIARTVPLIK